MGKKHPAKSPELASLLGQLEEAAYKLGIDVRYEDLTGQEFVPRGGLFRLRGKRYIIINQKDSMAQQAKTIARALKSLDLESIYLRPALRNFINMES